MSVYPNVTQRDLINLCKLAEQQKNQGAEKSKVRILKQTHDIKFAESVSPITKKLDEVKKSNQKIGVVGKENNTLQLAIENTHTTHQPIENKEGRIYYVELEKTLKNMKDNSGFFKTKHAPKDAWMLNYHSIKTLRDTEVEIDKNKYIITPGTQKVFTETSNIHLKNLNDKDIEMHENILKDLNFENYKTVND